MQKCLCFIYYHTACKKSAVSLTTRQASTAIITHYYRHLRVFSSPSNHGCFYVHRPDALSRCQQPRTRVRFIARIRSKCRHDAKILSFFSSPRLYWMLTVYTSIPPYYFSSLIYMLALIFAHAITSAAAFMLALAETYHHFLRAGHLTRRRCICDSSFSRSNAPYAARL